MALRLPLLILIAQSDKPDWTEEERQKLIQDTRQAGLFDEAEAKRIKTLHKVPFDFHYRYACGSGADSAEYRDKIADWEAGALYWNCYRQHGDGWEAPFRAKLAETLPAADMMFLMGTIHRFPEQWLIVSLIYPPRQLSEPARQGALFDQ